MESLAARTADGTYMLATGRGELGKVRQLELHLSVAVGDDTKNLRQVLGDLTDMLYSEGACDLRGRLNALISELFEQDEAAEVPEGDEEASHAKGP